MTNSRQELLGIVLAAGQGRRLGYPKSRLCIGGHWALAMITSALKKGGCSRVKVILSQESKQAIEGFPELDVEFLINPDPSLGASSSIKVALQNEAKLAAALIHPCDVPLLSASVVQKLIAGWRNCEQSENLVVRPVTPAGKGGHPLLVAEQRIPDIMGLSDDESLRKLLLPREQRLDLLFKGDPGPFLGVNTDEQHSLIESFIAKPK